MKLSNKYDVIIIGAGVGGLFCGCLLAKFGLKILIIEKNNKVGGCATSININNYVFDMGAHLIGGYNPGGLLSYLLKKIDLKVDLIKLIPCDRFTFSGSSIEVPADLSEYINNLQKMFPKEKSNIKNFFAEIRVIYTSYIARRELLYKYINVTYKELLDNFIKDLQLKGILSAQCLNVGLPATRASAIAMSFMSMSYLRDGTFYARGGIQNFVNALANKIIEYSGVVITNTEVKKIKIDNTSAKEVVLSNGSIVEGKVIVSNIDAEKTFLSLIDDSYFKEMFSKKTSKMKRSLSSIRVHLGIESRKFPLQQINGWHFKDYNIMESCQDALYVFVPTLFDRTIAPKDKDVLQITQLASYEEHEIDKPKIIDMCLKKINRILGIDLSKETAMAMASSPEDIEFFTGNSHGAAFGWEMSPQNILENRLTNNTIIKNLFLVGHWTNPGCGILGVSTSAMITSKMVMEFLNE